MPAVERVVLAPPWRPQPLQRKGLDVGVDKQLPRPQGSPSCLGLGCCDFRGLRCPPGCHLSHRLQDTAAVLPGNCRAARGPPKRGECGRGGGRWWKGTDVAREKARKVSCLACLGGPLSHDAQDLRGSGGGSRPGIQMAGLAPEAEKGSWPLPVRCRPSSPRL